MRQNLASPFPPSRIVLITHDVEMYEVTGGGLLEPKADQSETVRQELSAQIHASLRARRHEIVPYALPAGRLAPSSNEVQLFRLYQAVKAAILHHRYEPYFHLPAMAHNFDYSLGSTADAWKTRFDAAYALFVSARASTPSLARVRTTVEYTMKGHSLPQGHGNLTAALVDLQNGAVIWFNHIETLTPLYLHERDTLSATVQDLLEGAPL